MSTAASNIVAEWLRSLQLGRYAESFLDNGYDDLEICKQVGDPDLDAIGVFEPSHRSRLLQSVRALREEGAASVYFTLEEAAAAAAAGELISPAAPSGVGDPCDGMGDPPSPAAAGGGVVSPMSTDSVVPGRYLDEYEEGKAEMVRIPRPQLRLLLRERLDREGIRLSCRPYSTSSGERGYLEGLASRYSDILCTHFVDVLRHLEELRIREWEDLSPRIRVLGGGLGDTGATPGVAGGEDAATPASPLSPQEPENEGSGGGTASTAEECTPGPADMSLGGLTTSLSQPIYVPGKYSPSSCLSDREEDEIYGFGGSAAQATPAVVPGGVAAPVAVVDGGYGVFGHRMIQRQRLHRRIVFSPSPPPPVVVTGIAPPPSHYTSTSGPPSSMQLPFQSCLSPRSAYFYEFPPEAGGSSGTSKKKTTFSRIFRGLKTHRKDKSSGTSSCSATVSPRHAMQAGQRPNIVPATLLRVGTPDGALETSTVLPTVSDPLDYDRLHYLQVNGGAASVEATTSGGIVPTSFEETIQRLKVQEAMRKKERFHKEHEEILRDIRQGLLRVGQGPSGRSMLSSDDTYMYDDDVVVHRNPALEPHWYDEPPYESDPEDFLMGDSGVGNLGPIYGGIPGSSNGRVCFTLNLRPDQHGQNVISLRSAGDISLPREGAPTMLPPWIARSTLCPRDVCGPGRRHALLLPQQPPLPPTPSRRESGDYAGSDAQSVASTLSVETSRSEQEGASLLSPTPHQRGAHQGGSTRQHRGADLRRQRKKKSTTRGGVGGGTGSGGGGYSSRSTASVSAGSEEGQSGSSDNEEDKEDELEGEEGSDTEGRISGDQENNCQQDSAIGCSGSRVGASLVGRIRQGVQRKISRLRSTHSVDESVAEEEEANGREGKPSDDGSVHGGSSHILGSGSSASDLIKASSAAGFGTLCSKGKECKRGQRSMGSPSSRHQSPINSQSSPAPESSARLSNGSPDSLLASSSSQAQWTSHNTGCSPSVPIGDGQGGIWSSEIMGNAKARALVDYTPSPYDTDALKFKKGDIIDILSMNASGLWRGHLNGRIGTFKFINVEPLLDSRGSQWRRSRGTNVRSEDDMGHFQWAERNRSHPMYQPRSHHRARQGGKRGRPRSVEELLQRISLEEHISVFVLNGYEDLELFKDLEEEDLDYLGICNAEHRAKILTAVELLHDYDSSGSPLSDHGDNGRGEDATSTDGSASHSSSSTSFHSRSHHLLQTPGDRHSTQHGPPPPSPPVTDNQVGEVEMPNDLDWVRHHSWRQRQQQATSPSGIQVAPGPPQTSGGTEVELYLPNIPVGLNEDICSRVEMGPMPGRLAAVIESASLDAATRGGGGEAVGGGDIMSGGGRCFSEKSSDSGISSSSRSPPAHPRRGNNSEVGTSSSLKPAALGVQEKKGVMR